MKFVAIEACDVVTTGRAAVADELNANTLPVESRKPEVTSSVSEIRKPHSKSH